jgi:hypothetical protein
MHRLFGLAPAHPWKNGKFFNNPLRLLFGCWRENLEFCGWIFLRGANGSGPAGYGWHISIYIFLLKGVYQNKHSDSCFLNAN